MLKTALLTLLAACGLHSRERHWEKEKSTTVELDTLATVTVPRDLRYEPRRKLPNGNNEPFDFERLNDSHSNGQNSYAEDVPLEPGESRWQWTVKRENYEHHPVCEPSWRIHLTDRETNVELEWRGFRKHDTVETAKRNLEYLAKSIQFNNRKAWFQARRDWPTDGWRENLPRVQRELAALGRARAVEGIRVKDGDLRYIISQQRPQHFILALQLGAGPEPPYPVDLQGPVTRYTCIGTRIWQQNQGGKGVMLEPAELFRLRPEMNNLQYVYYYSIQTLNLWGTPPTGVKKLIEQAREMLARYKAGTLVTRAPR